MLRNLGSVVTSTFLCCMTLSPDYSVIIISSACCSRGFDVSLGDKSLKNKWRSYNLDGYF